MDDVEERWLRLQEKLARHVELLRQQGTVVRKPTPGGGVWVVRYTYCDQGKRRMGTIYIGRSPILAERARRLLAQYRRDAAWRDEVKHLSRLCAMLAGAVKRQVAGGTRASRRKSFLVGTPHL